MRDTTNKNLHSRHTWLSQVLSKEITPSKAQLRALSSMRGFCKLEVAGCFTSISLNSLKQAAKVAQFGISGSSLWDKMLQMRTMAFALLTPKVNPAPAPNLPSDKDQARIALLEAHIASMAYFDILTFLERIDPQNTRSADEIRAAIALKVKTSKAKYHSFLISDQIFSSEKMKVIDGGKKDG